MRHFHIAFLLLCAVALLTACRNGDDNPESSSTPQHLLAQGETVYVEHCAKCHGISGEGQNPDNPLAKDETGRYPAPPHNETGHTWHHDDDLLVRIIKEGGMGDENFYEMPAFGDQLTEEEINAVLAYIKSLWTDEIRELQQETTRRVRSQE
ncbi:MAG: cytochrome c [Chloroflexi bacterium]|nr:cytochrome c [Chloroflexota bacterium]